MKTDKYRNLVKEIKLSIDKNADLMGREIKNAKPLDHFLIAATWKSVRLCDSIIVLCDKGFSDESFPVLRSIMEVSVNMRWIMKKDTNNRLKQYLADLKKEGFGDWWTRTNMEQRMKEIGFHKNYYKYVTKVTYSFSHVNAKALNWSVVKENFIVKPFSSEAVFTIIAQMLIGVMEALNKGYPKFFGNFKYYAKQIPTSKIFRTN